MSKPLEPSELAEKIDWEGSLVDVLEYAYKSEHLSDADPDLKEAWERLCELWPDFSAAMDAVEDLLRHHS